MTRSCSCKLEANRLVGVQAVNKVASKTAIPSVLKNALKELAFLAGRMVLGAGVGTFVDSMFYFMIFAKKQSRKGRKPQFMSSRACLHICLDSHFTGYYDEF